MCMRPKSLIVLALALILTVPLSAADNGKSTPAVTKAFKEVVAKPSESTVAVFVGGKQVALGTVIDSEGYILTKDSQLVDEKGKAGLEITCKTKDGKEYTARKIGMNEPYDIALMKLEVDSESITFHAVEWSPSKIAPVGNWVAAPGLGDVPVTFGVVSVAARKMPPNPFRSLNPKRGYLGVSLADFDKANEKGVKVTDVSKPSAADKAGLKADDVILSVNGKETPNMEVLKKTIGSFSPGDTLKLVVKRGDKKEEFKATLDKVPENRGDMQNNLGSKLSDRRDGFPVALQHDSVIKPTDCGGPLVDLDGHVIGINIARGGRTDSYAIPSEEITKLLPDLMSKVSKVLDDRITEMEKTVATAETEKIAAEKKLKDAQASLERLKSEKSKPVKKEFKKE